MNAISSNMLYLYDFYVLLFYFYGGDISIKIAIFMRKGKMLLDY